jgi:hypothetical protein
VQPTDPRLDLFVRSDVHHVEIVSFRELLAELIDQLAIAPAAKNRVAKGHEFFGHRATQTTRDTGDYNDFLF